MFKIGDKLKKNWTLEEFDILDINSQGYFYVQGKDGIVSLHDKYFLHSNFTKIDSDADSTGLYGVDYSGEVETTVAPLIYPGIRTFGDPSAKKDWAAASYDPKTGNYTLPTGKYNISSSIPFSWDSIPVVMDDGHGLPDPFAKEVKCECGALKTYGESCNPEFHMSYCQMGKK